MEEGMSDNIQDDFEGNILNADKKSFIEIEGTNGKTYIFDEVLPVKAGNIFNSYMALYGLNKEPETAAEIAKAANMALEYTVATIAAQNEKKYPELTTDAIIGTDENPGIFEADEIGQVHYIYLAWYLRKANRKMNSKTKDKSKKKVNPEGVA